MNTEYMEAKAKNDEAIAEYKFYLAAYRTMQIDDAEFLAAKSKYDAAMAEFDIAYAKVAQ